MKYDITYTRKGQAAFETLETTEQTRIRDKLGEIATNEFRHPREWDFRQLTGCADGRFKVGLGLRIFADIDDNAGEIRVHNVCRRENLYT